MIEEKCLNKADIILYLILNSYFLTMASETPNETYKACFKNAVNELNKNIENGPQPTQRNYTKMINIVSTLRYIDAFSLTKDEVFDYIDTQDIDIPESWFIDKIDKKRFSGKNILKFLRDAFAHSNINELYKITENGEYIIIDMKGTKPKPLNLKIPTDDMEVLVKYIGFSPKAYHTTGMEIDNSKEMDPKDFSTFFDRFKFVRFLYPKKINENKSLKYKVALSRLDSANVQKMLLEKASQLEAEKKVYELTKTQKKEMLRQFKAIANRKDILSNKNQLINFIMYYMRIILPIGTFKAAFNQNENVLVYDNFMSDWNNSNAEYKNYIQTVIADYMHNYGQKQNGNLLYDAFGDNTDIINLMLKYISDSEAREMNNLALLASFYFRTIDNQETFDCNRKILPVNRIRNAFAHGRWGIGKNGEFHLYDWPGGIKNEMNANWESCVTIEELFGGIQKNFFESLNTNDINFDLLDNDNHKTR